MHKLLLRQLKRTLGIAAVDDVPTALRSFVDEAYTTADADRALLERSLELTSEELSQRNAELAHSNQELQQFAAVVSHDLQEPLRGIAGYAQLLVRLLPPDDRRAAELVEGIVGSTRRMNALIQDLLGYARVGSGGTHADEVDLAELATIALANLKVAREESGAEVVVGELPTLCGDRTQLTQLFQNLLGNAFKFRGETPLRVEIGAQRRGKEWIVSVEDNGIGIPAEHAERIFQIFQRVHDRVRYPGTGLGLAICDRILKNHGGRIWVRPRPAGGTVFAFAIPDPLSLAVPR